MSQLRDVQIVVDVDNLSRRVLQFYWFERSGIVLDYDCDQRRQTPRHKWKTVQFWSRLDQRDATMQRRDVPDWIKQKAVALFREQIVWSEQCSG